MAKKKHTIVCNFGNFNPAALSWATERHQQRFLDQPDPDHLFLSSGYYPRPLAYIKINHTRS